MRLIVYVFQTYEDEFNSQPSGQIYYPRAIYDSNFQYDNFVGEIVVETLPIKPIVDYNALKQITGLPPIGTVTCLFTGLPVIVTGHNNVRDAFVPDNFDYYTGITSDSFNDEEFPI